MRFRKNPSTDFTSKTVFSATTTTLLPDTPTTRQPHYPIPRHPFIPAPPATLLPCIRCYGLYRGEVQKWITATLYPYSPI